MLSTPISNKIRIFVIKDKEPPVLTNNEIEHLTESIRVVIYARVSTTDQAERGYSLESQVEKCYELAKKNGYKDDEILAIVEAGKSGDDPNRPALNFALQLLEYGVANGGKFICLHPDRFSRSSYQGTSVMYKIWSYGTDIEYVEMNFDPDNPESMLMYNIQLAIAQYNKSKILANSRRGRRQKVKRGEIPGLAYIFGYDFDKENDTLIENVDEKECYLTIVDWFLNGKDRTPMTLSGIARELAKEGYKPPKGKAWYATTIYRILRNPVYMGKFYYGKTEVQQKNGERKQVKKAEDEWMIVPVPKYIDEVTWIKIQEKLDEHDVIYGNGGRPTQNYLLKGLLKCGRCGGNVAYGGHSKTKTHHYRYYACTNKKVYGWEVYTGLPVKQPCRGRNWRSDIIDHVIWYWLLGKLQNPNQLIESIMKQQDDPEEIKKLKDRMYKLDSVLREKEDERQRNILAFRKGWITEEEMDVTMKKLDADIKSLKDEMGFVSNILKNMSLKSDGLNELKESIEIYNEIINKNVLTVELKQQIVRTFIKQVTLKDDSIEIFSNWGVN
ncbi:resolvase-like protein [Collibacillus ludicampi]|uniref:Resolvase-like protein n=1 Tax=Collibacillus ludicampi TaxID=2771369 RepID=A0AAV4L9N7_9BACL|nr:recombinase family protein [Collibacillus ludicampi]GIM44491.1 resolvase-like protein [Collibacillus ludicampi]